MFEPHQRSASRRGYGHAHKKRRAALLPHAYGKPCPLCGLVMERTQELDLDHSTPLAIDRASTGDRIVHRTCNRRAGARLGNARSRQDIRGTVSRDW